MEKTPPYVLDDQIGFILRRATQRHLSIFSDAIPEVTTTQFAALARLVQMGPLSQNHLGRATAMDAATIKGVVDRLRKHGLVETAPDPDDRRRLVVSASAAGESFFERTLDRAFSVSSRTLSPLSAEEQQTLILLLSRLT